VGRHLKLGQDFHFAPNLDLPWCLLGYLRLLPSPSGVKEGYATKDNQTDQAERRKSHELNQEAVGVSSACAICFIGREKALR
jgi:hypothetical protein